MDERIRQARLLYEQAVFSGDERLISDADQELDAVEADLAVARGRLIHTRFLLARDLDQDQAVADPGELALFERAAGLYRELGDLGGEAEALFWTGCFHQIVQRDGATATPFFERSLELATQATDKATMAEALRHLGICAHATGHLDVARQRLEESTKLRRQIGLLPGVAANLVGLAYIAAGQRRGDDIRALLAILQQWLSAWVPRALSAVRALQPLWSLPDLKPPRFDDGLDRAKHRFTGILADLGLDIPKELAR